MGRFMKKGKGYQRKYKVAVPKNIKTYVHRVVDAEPEIKQWAIQYANIGIPNTTMLNFILNVMGPNAGQQGVGDYNRLGAKVKVVDIEFRCTIQINAAAGFGNLNKVRMIVFIDKKADGLIVPSAELLYDVAANQAVSSPFNTKYKHEYTILKDHTFAVNNVSSQIAVANTTVPIVYKHKFKRPLNLSYYVNAAGQTVAAIEGPAIYVAFVAESTAMTIWDAYGNMNFIDA